jgi:ATP-dependent RNA helicase DDX3X
MPTSWADSVANSAESGASNSGVSRPTRSSYVPPHLRNRPPSSDPPVAAYAAPAPDNNRPGYGGAALGGSRWGGPSRELGRSGFGGGGRGGGWNNRTGGWDRGREWEANPFEQDEKDEIEEQALGEQENTGINFDAYEDIPVETSGDNVPLPVNTFADIDLGDALNKNIQRCKYVKPTPVQRHTIPISLAGRDLMACAQTGSGKTAAFCFPIISGIMKGQIAQRPRGPRTVYPLALILSPTRELSCQVIPMQICRTCPHLCVC